MPWRILGNCGNCDDQRLGGCQMRSDFARRLNCGRPRRRWGRTGEAGSQLHWVVAAYWLGRPGYAMISVEYG